MKIGGVIPLSLVDYLQRPAVVIFTSGCNLRCPFCHNRELVEGRESVDHKQVLAFLEKRAGKLGAVCISGGEPTVQEDLEEFICEIKSLGYRVKLDTNGSRPKFLKRLLAHLDYVALDIKSSPCRYRAATGGKLAFDTAAESAKIIKESGVAYELRTTAVPGLVAIEDLAFIARRLGPVQRYAVQMFRPAKTLNPALEKAETYPADWFAKAKKALEGQAKEVLLRGI